MGNLKKLIAAVLVCTAAVFCLYSQSQVENSSTTNTEETIFLDSTANNTNSTATTTEYKGTSTIGTFVRMIIALIIVVALIYGVFWFVKKKTNIVKSEDDYLRRAAYINIAPGKTVEVITLIDKAYLIGVTEDNITLLGEIDDKELIEAMNINADKKANSKKPVNFSQVLDSFLTKGAKNKNVFADQESTVENLFNGNSENREDV